MLTDARGYAPTLPGFYPAPCYVNVLNNGHCCARFPACGADIEQGDCVLRSSSFAGKLRADSMRTFLLALRMRARLSVM